MPLIRTLTHALAAAVLTLAAAVFAAGPASADIDCDDFASAEAAQRFYLKHRGDPYDLDRDGDGRACEWGPSAPARSTSRSSTYNEAGSTGGDGVPGWVWVGALVVGAVLLNGALGKSST